MERHRILIVDKDPVVRRIVRANLEARNYDTFLTTDGAVEALHVLDTETPDMVIFDVMPPNGAGLELCRRIRELTTVPMLVISERSDDDWKVQCFDAGADDFIPKPFAIEEMMARIRAVLRRSESVRGMLAPPRFRNGNLEIRFAERRVTVAEREVRLTPTEYNLLQELALNPDKVLTHNLLLNRVWGPQYNEEREYLRVFIGRLRRKLETDPRNPDHIVTIPWIGYKLNTLSNHSN